MNTPTDAGLGWSAHFDRQLDAGDTSPRARIVAVHRDRVEALTPDGPALLRTPEETGHYAVGDWVLHDGVHVTRLMDRETVIQRRSAGPVAKDQLIAANVGTLGIVTSCNDDFNEARLERYLAIAAAGGCLPMVVLTKADLTDEADDYARRAQRLSPLATVLTLDAREPEEARRLDPWCRDGQTLALVGSSGVGKTTLQNALTGIEAATRGIREDDAKGRHTTPARALRRTLAGGWLIDTPGMRELQLSGVAEGIAEVFADIEDLTTACRFRDCAHEAEPGCAVQAAIGDGRLDAARLERWRKLGREDRYNSESIAQARARFRAAGKMHRHGKTRGDWKRGDR
ncbi:ribosome small subunit-dependent GTPase A [Wenxinia marina]|uniref:Small ribosomal subunit biogenesis GTPase RsgA n=1 Tax=Wenxinia marina DSM 24838 TaxID=1123501 RepID=A0A0D0P758_9RHOB|nr:ribosome small subunit-dependent GTPase A [Wenxinia marina]KIQ67421.1 ribosome small subunit-dependent GTPase A [Wenxinia marina DSM 24838]GGL69610.1 putative ribosome biogenesis GTPase RsgA [Wenxinia marina]